MNKEKHRRRAMKFRGEDAAYIHAEVKNGHPEIIMTGHSVAILYCISRIVKEVAETAEVSPSYILDTMKNLLEDEIKEDAADKTISIGNFPF
jgi:hypothetical protein